MLVYLVVLLSGVLGQKNNVCRRIGDYDTIDTNRNCWYNPDVDLDVPHVIERHGYPLEVHSVITDDGYDVMLFRIPHGLNGSSRENRQPVFLQHGVLASTASWVINGNNSLGFILADNGYDVWLGNSRGSKYGKGHARYSTQQSEYWNFTYHEMATQDLPSFLDLISETTGRKDIIYLGQSMGCTLAYVYSSTKPKHASQRLKLIVSLAPAVFLKHMKTPLKGLAKHFVLLQNFTTMGTGEFLPNNPLLMKDLCLRSKFSFILCEIIAFVTYGFNPEQFLPELFPVILSHYPAGTSIKTFKHLSQGVYNNSFAQYDYGPAHNLAHYGSVKPPEYNLTKISIPNYIMYSENDFISTKEDVLKLYKKLPNTIGMYKLKNNKFTHFDFFFSKDVYIVIFQELLRVLERYKRNG